MAIPWMTLIIIGVIIAVIWLFVEIKRFRHKIFAVFLILLILFGYFSFVVVFKDKKINYQSISGLTEAGKIYFSWLGSIAKNMKSMTTYTLKLNWKAENETAVKLK